MLKKIIILLLVLEVLLIAAIVVIFAYEPKPDVVEKFNQSVQESEIFCFSDNRYTSYSESTFNTTKSEDFDNCDYIRIDMDVLSELDADKVVELIDSGIIITVRGEAVSPQEIVRTLGITDISVDNAEVDCVKIYKLGNSYICEEGGVDIVMSKDRKPEIVFID